MCALKDRAMHLVSGARLGTFVVVRQAAKVRLGAVTVTPSAITAGQGARTLGAATTSATVHATTACATTTTATAGVPRRRARRRRARRRRARRQPGQRATFQAQPDPTLTVDTTRMLRKHAEVMQSISIRTIPGIYFLRYLVLGKIAGG